MATVEKDFKVKNGLLVAAGGRFGGTVQIAEPTLANEATTKLYVDNQINSALTGISYADAGSPETESFDDVFDGGAPGTVSWEAVIDSGGVANPGGVGIFSEAPDVGVDGDLYFNTETNRLSIFYNNQWIVLANLSDAGITEIPQHIHDTSIGGNGMVVSTFVDSGFYLNTEGALASAGFYNTASWDNTYDGGSAVDNFN
jgi:hypothetical protein